MPKRMLVHDRRLHGNAPAIAQNTYVVDKNTSTSHIVGWVGQYARSQSGLDELIIMCHGYVSHVDNLGRQSTIDASGSTGLQLGADDLTLSNVGLTSRWNGHIRKVYLYACGVAAGNSASNPAFDGRRFCGEMALHSGAKVYASNLIQWYHRNRTGWQRIWGSNAAGTINFGAWEGQVFCYSPTDGRGRPVRLGPQPT